LGDGKLMLRSRPPRVKHVVEGSFNHDETLVLSRYVGFGLSAQSCRVSAPRHDVSQALQERQPAFRPNLIGAAHELNFAA
jgi:hypothetical protein